MLLLICHYSIKMQKKKPLRFSVNFADPMLINTIWAYFPFQHQRSWTAPELDASNFIIVTWSRSVSSRGSCLKTRQKRSAQLNHLELWDLLLPHPPTVRGDDGPRTFPIVPLCVARTSMTSGARAVEPEASTDPCRTNQRHHPQRGCSPLYLLPGRDSTQQLLLRRTCVAGEENIQHFHEDEKHTPSIASCVVVSVHIYISKRFFPWM